MKFQIMILMLIMFGAGFMCGTWANLKANTKPPLETKEMTDHDYYDGFVRGVYAKLLNKPEKLFEGKRYVLVMYEPSADQTITSVRTPWGEDKTNFLFYPVE